MAKFNIVELKIRNGKLMDLEQKSNAERDVFVK